MNGWIGVDLDGTLAEYTKWQGIRHFGQPIIPMVLRIKMWLDEGIEVRIFTARVAGLEGDELHAFTVALHKWLAIEAMLPPLQATNVKDFNMLELYDDRAVQVELNTGKLVGYSTRERGLE
ncbi:MAG: hypothetical protein EOR11_19975 [Mesorhizobium sp.]|uniref:hypothetical protein n=1 Tax=Mesorhizobium sp. TaxID=1871066 RepID=UPI000FE49EF6|nr:hypothetical protein [Mesorhizobium sp.]RWP84741.1 MAG: hypothetical protein EOR11_19975 [Mesorhizobium sp.]